VAGFARHALAPLARRLWTEPNSIAAANGPKIVLTRRRAASSIEGFEKHAT
jgi:hypothetical protein